VCNRRIEKQLAAGSSAVVDPSGPDGIAPRLEKLRLPVATLLDYRENAPWKIRWGLSQTDDLVPPAQTAYCQAIRPQVLQPLIRQMTKRLHEIRNPASDPAADLKVLKAYMMMTSHPSKADASFLGQQLFDLWKEARGGAADPEAARYLPGQLGTYGALLSIPDAQNSCTVPAEPGLIAAAQGHLRGLNINDRYSSLLQRAGKGLKAVNYSQRFPNDTVTDEKIVPGYFTRPGWIRMQELLEHPEESLKGDAWVLGQSRDLTPEEVSTLGKEIQSRYFNDYVQAWKDYLGAAAVTSYANLADAAAKIEKMSDQHSLLLALIGLSAEHTGVSDQVKAIFQPARTVAAGESDFQGANDYLQKLGLLQTRLLKASKSSGAERDQSKQEARNAEYVARDAVEQLARTPAFRGDADQLVKAILLKPLKEIDPVIDQDGIGALNARGKAFCDDYIKLAGKLPFARKAGQSASVEDVHRLLRPDSGLIWEFERELRDSLDCTDTSCAPKSNAKVPITRGFAKFFGGLMRLSRLLYGGRKELLLTLHVRALPLNGLKQLDLSVDNQHFILPAGGEFQNIAWDPRQSQNLEIAGTFETEKQTVAIVSGQWAVFEWLFDANSGGGGSAGFKWTPRGSSRLQLNKFTYGMEVKVGEGSGQWLDLAALTPGGCVLPASKSAN
jgi:type VI protein secretion system component VasK